MAPLSKSLTLIGISWLGWGVGNNEVMGFASLDTYGPMNHFHATGSFFTSIILLNLMWCNIFSVQPFDKYKPFKAPKTRFGNMGTMIIVLGIIQWLIMVGIATACFPEVRDNFMKTCEGAWTILCYTWYAFTIVGAHISPYLWPWMDRQFSNKIWLWICYCVICLALGALFTVALYFIYTEFLDKIIVNKILGVDKHEHPFGNPGYYWAFGAANIPYTYQMMKSMVVKQR